MRRFWKNLVWGVAGGAVVALQPFGIDIREKVADAIGCCPTVYDPATEAAVFGVGSTLSNVFSTMQQVQRAGDNLLLSTGIPGTLGASYPSLANMLPTSGSELANLGAIALMSRAGGGVSTRLTSMPISMVGLAGPLPVTTYGDPALLYRTIMTDLVPQPGEPESRLKERQRQRSENFRRAQEECLTVALNQLASAKSSAERIGQLRSELRDAKDARAQSGVTAAILLQLVEETVASQSVQACQLRLATTEAMDHEPLRDYSRDAVRSVSSGR